MEVGYVYIFISFRIIAKLSFVCYVRKIVNTIWKFAHHFFLKKKTKMGECGSSG